MGSRGNFDHHGLRWTLGGGGYQFYTTSPNVRWAIWNDPLDFCPGGSMIYCKTPKFNKNPLDPNITFTESELDNVKLYAYPTFSLVEYPPKHNENYECGWAPMPSYVDGDGGLNEIMNASKTFAASNAWQINGIAEHVYYSIEYDGTKNKIAGSILTAHQQPGGHVFSLGMHSPARGISVCDVGYDMAPQKVKRDMSGQMPDADWPERAGMFFVGDKLFIILHTANDEFVCWPYLNPEQLDYSITSNADPKLKAQGYKSNVPNKYAKTIKPLYPDWVHSPDGRRSEKDNPLNQAIEPRVTFSFDSTGRHAVAAMVERIPISDIGPAYFQYYDIYPEDGNAPIEKDSDIPITIDSSKYLYGISDPKELQYDRLGIVGLEFIVKITGPSLDDFDFISTVYIDISPDDIATYPSGALVAVGYAQQSVSNPLNDRITEPRSTPRKAVVIEPPLKDELVTAFMTLYQHEDQKKYDLGRYSCVGSRPTKSKISFYKGKDSFKTASNPILELPLTQWHGSGYVGESFIDPITGEVITRVPPAHEFVDYSYSAFINKYLTPEDPRPPRYVYTAEIRNLDITTMSFYYTAVINKRTIDSDFYKLENPSYDYHKNFNEQSQLCSVYIFGKIASDTYVGDNTLAQQLVAWVDNAPQNFPEDKEEMIPTTYKNLDLDLYYTEQFYMSENKPSAWWFEGACGVCVDSVVAGFVFDFDPYNQKVVDSYNPADPFPLSISKPLTEEGAKELLHYIVGVFGEYYAGNIKHTVFFRDDTKSIDSVMATCNGCVSTLYEPEIIPFECGYFDYPGYTENYHHFLSSSTDCSGQIVGCKVSEWRQRSPTLITVDKCRGNINPFKLAKSDFDEDKFVDQVAWYFAKYVNILLYNKDNNTSYAAHELMSNGLTFTLLDESLFGLDYSFAMHKRVFIRNYDWGVDFYNRARESVTMVGSNTTVYGTIVTTPEGHYSYYLRDLYIIKDKFASLATQCFSNDKRYMSSFDTRVGNDENLNKDSFEWKLVEGIGWYYGLIKTTHMDMYNMAFSEKWREEMRNTEKRNPPYALKKELPTRVIGDDIDFSPTFVFKLSTSPIRGEPLYSPSLFQGAGITHTIQEEVRQPVILSNYDFPGRDAVDDRDRRKHIRLSPLFF